MASPPSIAISRRGIASLAGIGVLAALVIAGPSRGSADVRAKAGAAVTPPHVALRGYLRDKRGGFTTVMPPGAVGSKLGDINNRGQIVGAYSDGTSIHNFVRDRGGEYTTFDFPGAPETAAGLGDINDRGQVAGFYPDTTGTYRSFLRSGHGAFTPIDHPRAGGTSPYGSGTAVYGINDRGVIVGAYAAGGTVHGFLRDRNGTFRTVDYPGSAETVLSEINERGQVVGAYGDDVGSGTPHDFVLDHGAYTSIEFPGASESFVDDVNNRGNIVGYYFDPAGATHGYLRDRTGRYSPIDHPDAVPPGSDTNGLNDRGEIVGEYYAYLDAGAHAPARRQFGLGTQEMAPGSFPGLGLPR
jgi:uncharacterized membrane protein